LFIYNARAINRDVRTLIIEDNVGIRTGLELTLQMDGHEATSTDCCEHALALLESRDFDLILLDLNTRGISAFEFMKRLNAVFSEDARPKVIVISGSEQIEFEAKRIGALNWLRKPFELQHLYQIIKPATNCA